MDLQPHRNCVPNRAARPKNAHKMDLDFLCSGLTNINISKPTDLTHNKREKEFLTSDISKVVLHTRTQIPGLNNGSIQKPSVKKPGKVGWKNSTSRAPKSFTVKHRYSSGFWKNNRRAGRAKVVSAKTFGGKKRGDERDPSAVSEIYAYDAKKGYRHICGECKRMYRFEINLLNHDIVDHHLDRAYLQLPSSRESPRSSRRMTENELITCAIFGGDASSTISNVGNPEQWLQGDLTILNVQWARYLFDDDWTVKICMDSGMSYGEVKEHMKKLDELENIDKEEFEAAKRQEDNTSHTRKEAGWWDTMNMEKALSKKDFALWKAAVVENELVGSMSKMMSKKEDAL